MFFRFTVELILKIISDGVLTVKHKKLCPFVTYTPVICVTRLTSSDFLLFNASTNKGLAMDWKRKANFMEDEIMAMAEEIEARQDVLLGGW